MPNPHPNTIGLKRTAGPGRPKGGRNALSLEMECFLASKEYQASAKQRILDGKAPHLEAHILQCVLPKTDHQVIGLDTATIRQIVHQYALPAAAEPAQLGEGEVVTVTLPAGAGQTATRP